MKVLEIGNYLISQTKKDPTIFSIVDSENIIVAETRMFDNDDDADTFKKLLANGRHSSSKLIGVKIKGYRVFVISRPSLQLKSDVISILNKMAECFRKEILDKRKGDFDKYKMPHGVRISKSQDSRESANLASKNYESLESKQTNDSWMMPILIIVGIILLIIGLATNYLLFIILLPLLFLAFSKGVLGEKKF